MYAWFRMTRVKLSGLIVGKGRLNGNRMIQFVNSRGEISKAGFFVIDDKATRSLIKALQETLEE